MECITVSQMFVLYRQTTEHGRKRVSQKGAPHLLKVKMERTHLFRDVNKHTTHAHCCLYASKHMKRKMETDDFKYNPGLFASICKFSMSHIPAALSTHIMCESMAVVMAYLSNNDYVYKHFSLSSCIIAHLNIETRYLP